MITLNMMKNYNNTLTSQKETLNPSSKEKSPKNSETTCSDWKIDLVLNYKNNIFIQNLYILYLISVTFINITNKSIPKRTKPKNFIKP